MATDIAFAVGVLALLGSRVPPALRILLLALAVIDDVGAILVIALFYSTGLNAGGFAVLALGIGMILSFQKIGVRAPLAYIAPTVVAWAGAYWAGIHPTLVGVIVGMLTPTRAWLGADGFVDRVEHSVDRLRSKRELDEHALLPHLDSLDRARREAVAPVERLQHALHGWVAYGIMPLFALANAGIPVGSVQLGGEALWPFLGVALGLSLGKPIGIVLAARIGVGLGWAALPRGITWSHTVLVGTVAGIGFTMSIFIANLAFQPGTMLETVKLGILAASGVAAGLGYVLGYVVLPKTCPPEAAQTLVDAETSTHL
jgi:NhaA family Na+:H+ antiporter